MSNFPIPNPWSLLEAIEAFPESTHEVVLFVADFESFRLLHIDFLFQFSCQECRHDVHLMNLQSVNCCDCKKYSDRCEFDDWCVGVEVVDAVDLAESSGDQSCLQPDDSCAFVLFVPECEFVGDDLAISGAWDKIPCMVLD